MLVGKGVAFDSPGALLVVVGGALLVVVAGADELVTVTPELVLVVPPSVLVPSVELQLDIPKAAIRASTMKVKVTRAGVQKRDVCAEGFLEEVMRFGLSFIFGNGL